VASPLRRRGAFLALQTPALLRKWLPIAVLIGIVAGVGAIVFYEAIGLCTRPPGLGPSLVIVSPCIP